MVMVGCVSIHDTIPIEYPSPVDQYNRNTLDKCTPHVNPHRLILAQEGLGSYLVSHGGNQIVNNQQDFDLLWNSVSPQLDPNNVPSSSLEPIIDWDHESAYFLTVPRDQTCQKAKPFGDEMVSDCYSVSLIIFRYNEGSCEQAVNYPVFIYIYAKTNLPVGIQWVYPTSVPTATAVPAPPARPTMTPTPTPKSESDDE